MNSEIPYWHGKEPFVKFVLAEWPWEKESKAMEEVRGYTPEGMRLDVAQAVHKACGKCDYHPQIRIALQAACKWLADRLHPAHNERVPKLQEIYDAERARFPGSDQDGSIVALRVAFEYGVSFAQNRIRELLSEPETPEDIKDLLISEQAPMSEAFFRPDIYNQLIREARQRGYDAGFSERSRETIG